MAARWPLFAAAWASSAFCMDSERVRSATSARPPTPIVTVPCILNVFKFSQIARRRRGKRQKKSGGARARSMSGNPSQAGRQARRKQGKEQMNRNRLAEAKRCEAVTRRAALPLFFPFFWPLHSIATAQGTTSLRASMGRGRSEAAGLRPLAHPSRRCAILFSCEHVRQRHVRCMRWRDGRCRPKASRAERPAPSMDRPDPPASQPACHRDAQPPLGTVFLQQPPRASVQAGVEGQEERYHRKRPSRKPLGGRCEHSARPLCAALNSSVPGPRREIHEPQSHPSVEVGQGAPENWRGGTRDPFWLASEVGVQAGPGPLGGFVCQLPAAVASPFAGAASSFVAQATLPTTDQQQKKGTRAGATVAVRQNEHLPVCIDG